MGRSANQIRSENINFFSERDEVYERINGIYREQSYFKRNDFIDFISSILQDEFLTDNEKETMLIKLLEKYQRQKRVSKEKMFDDTKAMHEM